MERTVRILKMKTQLKKGSNICTQKSMVPWHGLRIWNILPHCSQGWYSSPRTIYKQHDRYIQTGIIIIIWIIMVLEQPVIQCQDNFGTMDRGIVQCWKWSMLLYTKWKSGGSTPHNHSEPHLWQN